MRNSGHLAVDSTAALESPAMPIAEYQVAVIWIDWYAYHVARFQGLMRHPALAGRVVGLELVGGIGVHAGLKFREPIPSSLPVQTLLPNGSWQEAGKWQLARSLWRRLSELNPSVVLVPGYYTVPALAAALWAKLRGKTSVLMTESTGHDHARSWWREALKSLLIRGLFDWAVAGGAPHRRYLQQLGFPMARVAGYYDTVDNSFFHDCCAAIRTSRKPADFGLPQNYFLYVGRIAREKSTSFLVDSYIQYRVAGGMASLVLVGDGPQLKEMQSKATASAYSADIYFPGLKVASELPKYYAFASAFVLASVREPWGLVVNEAMASSLPVIVSRRCGCVEDLVADGENGFTFDPSESTALADCLIRFGQLSASERKTMGDRSYERVSRFSPDAWANEIHRIVRARA